MALETPADEKNYINLMGKDAFQHLSRFCRRIIAFANLPRENAESILLCCHWTATIFTKKSLESNENVTVTGREVVFPFKRKICFYILDDK